MVTKLTLIPPQDINNQYCAVTHFSCQLQVTRKLQASLVQRHFTEDETETYRGRDGLKSAAPPTLVPRLPSPLIALPAVLLPSLVGMCTGLLQPEPTPGARLPPKGGGREHGPAPWLRSTENAHQTAGRGYTPESETSSDPDHLRYKARAEANVYSVSQQKHLHATPV